MTRKILAVVLMATACGNSDDTGADVYATCDDIECPGAEREESMGDRSQSVTCFWVCTEYNGRPAQVTRTWTRDDPEEECFALANESVRDCPGSGG